MKKKLRLNLHKKKQGKIILACLTDEKSERAWKIIKWRKIVDSKRENLTGALSVENLKVYTEDVTLTTKIKDLHNQIKCLSENVPNFKKIHLTLFEKGQYSNYIRSAYEYLFCIGGIIRLFQIALRGRRWVILLWVFFFFDQVLGIWWGGEILTVWTFLKWKTIFCKYWTSFKIKTVMTCVYNEY